MDAVKWQQSSGMDVDDVVVSDNLLEFVKDEDLANDLVQDDILPQGKI